MSSSTSSAQSGQAPKGFWPLVAPYVVPPCAAAVALIPAYKDLHAKSCLQIGQEVQRLSPYEILTGGWKAGRAVGVIIAGQMALQKPVKEWIAGEAKEDSLFSILTSSAVIGMISSPFLAIFNRRTNPSMQHESLKASFRALTWKQAGAITVQETAFVAGLSMVDPITKVMKEQFGDNMLVEASAAFIGGAAGATAGHLANTALTRWQSNMKVENVWQLTWGLARRARGVGVFSMAYRLGKQLFIPNDSPSNK